MTLTDRQKFILRRFDEISRRKKMSGRIGYFLDGEDCTAAVNSLCAKGTLRKDPVGSLSVLETASGSEDLS